MTKLEKCMSLVPTAMKIFKLSDKKAEVIKVNWKRKMQTWLKSANFAKNWTTRKKEIKNKNLDISSVSVLSIVDALKNNQRILQTEEVSEVERKNFLKMKRSDWMEIYLENIGKVKQVRIKNQWHHGNSWRKWHREKYYR